MADIFSALENSINAAVIGAISNALMRWDGCDISVKFDAAYADPLGMAGSRPQAVCETVLIPGIVTGDSVTIREVAYTVQAIDPDGSGLTTLILRRA